MIARIAWYTVLGACALVTAGLQLDRQAGASPQLAGIVPQPFRSIAQARIVAASIGAGEPQEALDEAERLVLRRPAPAQSLRLLAIAQTKAGEIEQGIVSIQLASQRGWRDIAAQEAMARLALSAGDIPEAARRYTALLARAETSDALLKQLGPMVFDGPDRSGRSAMAQIIAGTERWNAMFLRRAPTVMSPEAFSEVAIDSIARGAQFDCTLFDRTVEGLDRRDAQAAAHLAEYRPVECRD